MAGKISEMDPAAALAGTERIECLQSGDNVYTTPDQIRDRAIGSLGSLTAASALDGTEIVGITQGGNPRRATTQEIADLGGGGSSLDDWLENWFHYGGSITLTNAFKTATILSGAGATGATSQVRCGLPRGDGKLYFEILVDSAGPVAQIACGVANQVTTANSFVGAAPNTAGNRHWCRVGNGNFARPGALDFGLLDTFTTGDVLGFALDLTPASGSRLMWFSKNGTFVGNPAAGTGATAATLADFVAPCAVVGGGGGGGVMTLRLRSTEFSYSPPSGFSAWL